MHYLLILGSYRCECKPGYISTETNEHGAAQCADWNECYWSSFFGIDLCPQDAHCSNFDGLSELKNLILFLILFEVVLNVIAMMTSLLSQEINTV